MSSDYLDEPAVIPAMKYRWAKMKSRTLGIMASTTPASTTETLPVPRLPFSPTRPSGRRHAATGEGRAPGERFIEEMFPVNITGTVSVALEIQDHRDKSRYHRRQAVKRRKLAKQEQLRFTITGTNVQSPFDVYWKVRNFGPEAAASKGGLRGTIEPDKGSHEKSESTLYRGSHYAECYIIKDGVCVAKKKTWVPIR